jgi:hypothetical protein
MQMTLRARVLDLLPVMVLFAVIAAFATAVVIRYVAEEPMHVPPPQTIPQDELPQQGPAAPR